jgi:hypothetical protein
MRVLRGAQLSLAALLVGAAVVVAPVAVADDNGQSTVQDPWPPGPEPCPYCVCKLSPC